MLGFLTAHGARLDVVEDSIALLWAVSKSCEVLHMVGKNGFLGVTLEAPLLLLSKCHSCNVAAVDNNDLQSTPFAMRLRRGLNYGAEDLRSVSHEHVKVSCTKEQ